MSSDEHELRAAWSRCVADSHDARVLFDSLIGRHREAHRHYHGVRHVTWVVRHVEELAAAEPVDDLDAVVVAAFFHDAIYDPLASDNEAASARLANRELTMLGWDEARRQRVAAMIEATATHVAPAATGIGTGTEAGSGTAIEPGIGIDAAALLDADLAVLGSDPASYQAYVAGVRSEYSHVSVDDWRTGRAHVLQSFLDRPALFATPTGRARWEARARANLAAEVASLRGPPTVDRMPASTSTPNSGLGHTGQTVELLQALIRNECVNDGTPDSGGETRNAELLESYLAGTNLDIERFEARPGRGSIVARIEGSDPAAPTLCLMGHTDVVPVSADGWTHDPFGGELIDGEVWGRGAIDMLNLTSSMAVAFKHLATTGFKPKGTLIYFGVADEEAGGLYGAEWALEHHLDALRSDYVLTELGGWSSVGHDGTRRFTVNVGEKGLAWRRLRITGTPGHGSMPFGSDNALVKAAEVVRRLSTYRPAAQISDIWRGQVAAMSFPDEIRAGLTDPDRLWTTLERLPTAAARMCHAMTHTTLSPNVAHGGQKTNVIPDVIDIDVDIRTVPGTTREDVVAMLADALGDLAPHVEVGILQDSPATESPTANPLWDAIAARTQVAFPGAELVPGLIVGGTDARYFRERGAVAYGAGLFSPSMSFETFGARFHGNDERIDVESLGLATDFWIGIAEHLLA